MNRGQPSLGAFLLKDENTDSNIITDVDSAHPVGMSHRYPAYLRHRVRVAERRERTKGLTAVLNLCRRIKIAEFVKAGGLVKIEESPKTVEHPP